MTRLLINTTYAVAPEVTADFLTWANDMCLPAAGAARGCSEPRLLRIIPTADDETPAYAVQVTAESPEAAHEWLNGPFRMLLNAFYAEHQREHLLYFITMMEVIG